MTLTSTYDHRIIQGAQSGEFLRRMHQLLLGEDAEAVHRLRCEHRDGEDRDQADVGGGPLL